MIFSPLYYQVQELIKKDDDKAIIAIYNNPELKEEFISYHEDFLHCTYPNSFKCLYFLMNDIHRRYNVHSVFSHSFKDNNTEWLTFFFDNYQKKMNEETKTDSIAFQIIQKNTLSMSINVDYESLVNSSPEVWDIMFKYDKCNIFKPHMLLDKIFDFEKDNLSKVYLFEEQCLQHKLEIGIKNILSKAFFSAELDICEYFLEKYPTQFSKNDQTDLINMVGLSNSKEVLQFFTQHILPFEDFNLEQISLVFHGGLLLRKTELMDYMKTTYNIDFYPDDEKLKQQFVATRHTMWDDNNYKISDTMTLLQGTYALFQKHNWNIEELKKETQYHDEISKLLSQIELNDKLNSRLEVKNKVVAKVKI